MLEEATAHGYEGPLYTARMDYQTGKYTLVDHRTREWIQRYTITRWAGGPVSVAVAHLVFGCQDVYLFGHDFNLSPDGTSQNIYLDTDNYDKTGDPARKQGHLIHAFARLDRDFPDLHLHWVGPVELRLAELDRHLRWMTYGEFYDGMGW